MIQSVQCGLLNSQSFKTSQPSSLSDSIAASTAIAAAPDCGVTRT
jgi:hypothetical protein